MSPGILCRIEFLPWTTSSWEKGSRKFSVKAYRSEKVSLLCSYLRWTGSWEKYFKVSFIQPMFHFKLKPSPPRYVGRDTAGQEVDSSAIVSNPGKRSYATSLSRLRNAMACRFSRPPNSLGTHWPSLRE